MAIIVLLLAFMSRTCGEYVHTMKIGHSLLEPFSWKNCNTTSMPFYVTALSISPYPIQYGESLIVTAKVEVSSDIGTSNQFQVDATILYKVQGKYSDMCHVIGQSYCHYHDVCLMLRSKKISCPDELMKQGTNCQCPFKKNSYTVTKFPIPIPSPFVKFSGVFNVTLQMSEKGLNVGCLQTEFCLGSCNSRGSEKHNIPQRTHYKVGLN